MIACHAAWASPPPLPPSDPTPTRALLRRAGMLFVEASAKTAANVAEVFESVAAKLAGGLPVSSSAAAPVS